MFAAPVRDKKDPTVKPTAVKPTIHALNVPTLAQAKLLCQAKIKGCII